MKKLLAGLLSLTLTATVVAIPLGGCFNDVFKKSTLSASAYEEEQSDVDSSETHEHIYKESILKNATCIEDGIKTFACECGKEYNETIPAIGHKFGSWTTTKKSTCKATGTQTRKCLTCGKTETKTIAKVAHKYNNVNTNSTYFAKGYTGKKCSVCGTVSNKKDKALLTMATPKASSNSTSSVKLSWSKVTGAKGYNVYQIKNNKWSKIKTVTGTSYTVSKLKAGTSYKFCVKPYTKSGSKTVYGNQSKTLATSTTPAKVNFNLTAGSKKVTVKWSKVTGATGYKVYYKTSKNGKWKLIKTVNNKTTSYTKSGLTNGKSYYFTVKAYRTVSGKTYNGKYLSNAIIYTKNLSNITQKEINSFFSQSGFVGHSVSLGLKYYFNSQAKGFLGNPKMLVRGCYSFLNDRGNNSYQLQWGGYKGPAKYVIKRAGIKYLFVNMGTNDFVSSVDVVYQRYVNYLNGIKKENPNIVIYIEASTPVYASGQRGGVTNKNMNALNKKMQNYCKTQSDMYFIDINTPLKNKNGSLAAKYSSDHYVHLTNAAYKVWIDTVVNYVKNQLSNEKYAKKAVTTYLSNKNNTNLKIAKDCVSSLEKSKLKTNLLNKLK